MNNGKGLCGKVHTNSTVVSGELVFGGEANCSPKSAWEDGWLQLLTLGLDCVFRQKQAGYVLW